MKVELSKDVKLKTADGRTFFHKAGDRLSLLRKVALRIIDRGQGRQVFKPPVKYQSKFLGETIWLVNDPSQFEEAEKRGSGLGCYTTSEYYHLSQMKKEHAKIIYEIKKVFPGSILLETVTALPVSHDTSQIENREEVTDMSRHSDRFPPRFLGQVDFPQPKMLTISAFGEEEIEVKDGTVSKFVLYFIETEDRGMILNSVNSQILEKLYGDDTEWPGKKVEVYTDPTIVFGGKVVGGLRLRLPSQPQSQESMSF